MVAARWLKRLPWWSIGLVAGCVAAWAIAPLADLLIYKRDAIAQGECWRLFTGHIVHYSGTHLLNNFLVLVPAALLIEVRSRRDLMRVLLVSMSAIGLAIWVFQPGISTYAGSSGIALALVTFAGLRGMQGNPRWRMVCGLVLILVAGKLAGESLFGWQPVDWERAAGFVTVKLAHVTGVASGLLVWCVAVVRDRRARFAAAGIRRIDQLGPI